MVAKKPFCNCIGGLSSHYELSEPAYLKVADGTEPPFAAHAAWAAQSVRFAQEVDIGFSAAHGRREPIATNAAPKTRGGEAQEAAGAKLQPVIALQDVTGPERSIATVTGRCGAPVRRDIRCRRSLGVKLGSLCADSDLCKVARSAARQPALSALSCRSPSIHAAAAQPLK